MGRITQGHVTLTPHGGVQPLLLHNLPVAAAPGEAVRTRTRGPGPGGQQAGSADRRFCGPRFLLAAAPTWAPSGGVTREKRVAQRVAQTLALQRVCGFSLGFTFCSSTAQWRTKQGRYRLRKDTARSCLGLAHSEALRAGAQTLALQGVCGFSLGFTLCSSTAQSRTKQGRYRLRKDTARSCPGLAHSEALRAGSAEVDVFCPLLRLLEL